MRMMALDIGEKNIGIAVSDKTNTLAVPYSIEKNDDNFEKTIYALVKQKDIGKIIIGIPYNLKGKAGFQAKKTIDIIEKLVKKLKENSNMDVVFWDERFSTKVSKNRLSDGKKKVKDDIDKYAAAVILEDYLNFNKKLQ
ncbi:MAG: Holliday junction resolvase RuvX [Actinomycetota bacterium]|nr:Holliday junction resolvase RuvX [Actinomycetota bacterium]